MFLKVISRIFRLFFRIRSLMYAELNIHALHLSRTRFYHLFFFAKYEKIETVLKRESSRLLDEVYVLLQAICSLTKRPGKKSSCRTTMYSKSYPIYMKLIQKVTALNHILCVNVFKTCKTKKLSNYIFT